jgi:hypothetical protein
VHVSNITGEVSSDFATLTVTSAEAPTAVNACRDITAPGSYRLQADLSASGNSACLSIHDTHDVQLDCDGHVLSRNTSTGAEALAVNSVQDYSVKNCLIEGRLIAVKASANGSITKNTLVPSADAPWGWAVIDVEQSSRMTFDSNTIAAGSYQQLYGDGNTVSRNHVTSSAGQNSPGATIVSVYSSGTRIIGNVIDGRATNFSYGADDGIGIQDERGAVIEDNSIQNVWDCGIELTGVNSSHLIRRNHITNAFICGVGGWYWLSVSDSTIAANTTDRAPLMFLFSRNFGLRPAGFDDIHVMPADTAVRFRDNVFEGNLLTNQTPLGGDGGYNNTSMMQLGNKLQYNGSLSSIAGERVPSDTEFEFSNNVFRDNDFGHVGYGPWFGPTVASGIINDGGGNFCKTPSIASYPLVCH